MKKLGMSMFQLLFIFAIMLFSIGAILNTKWAILGFLVSVLGLWVALKKKDEPFLQRYPIFSLGIILSYFAVALTV